MCMRSIFLRRSAAGFVLALVSLMLQACATPPEIKAASKNQLELIEALDSAVSDLQSAVARFHREQAELIRIEGRMLIARQAVHDASDLDKEVTADQFFEHFETNIRPWFTTDFTETTVRRRIAELDEQIATETDAIRRAVLVAKRNQLEVEFADPSSKPAGIQSIEGTIAEGIARERNTTERVKEILSILRAQIALMKAMQTRVDSWLSIDVTLTQQQAGELNAAFAAAHAALKEDDT